MRKSTATTLAMIAPATAAGAATVASLARGEGFGSPRPVAGAILAAIGLTAIAQVSPDTAGALAFMILFVTASLVPWAAIINRLTPP